MSASQRKQGSVKKRPAPVNYVAPTKEAVNAFFNRSRKVYKKIAESNLDFETM